MEKFSSISSGFMKCWKIPNIQTKTLVFTSISLAMRKPTFAVTPCMLENKTLWAATFFQISIFLKILSEIPSLYESRHFVGLIWVQSSEQFLELLSIIYISIMNF